MRWRGVRNASEGQLIGTARKILRGLCQRPTMHGPPVSSAAGEGRRITDGRRRKPLPPVAGRRPTPPGGKRRTRRLRPLMARRLRSSVRRRQPLRVRRWIAEPPDSIREGDVDRGSAGDTFHRVDRRPMAPVSSGRQTERRVCLINRTPECVDDGIAGTEPDRRIDNIPPPVGSTDESVNMRRVAVAESSRQLKPRGCRVRRGRPWDVTLVSSRAADDGKIKVERVHGRPTECGRRDRDNLGCAPARTSDRIAPRTNGRASNARFENLRWGTVARTSTTQLVVGKDIFPG